MNTKAKKGLKVACLSILLIILLLVTIVLGYVAYLSANYYRIADYTTLEINDNQEDILELNTQYSVATYNIGFGAYNRDFDFFMDSGVMEDGTEVYGTRAKAESKEVVLENTNGAISIMQSLDVDFAFFQEVDTASDRSYFVNQYEMIQEAFEGYSSTYASNFHSVYLFYPFNDPIGSIQSGIVTLSKYKIESSVRRSFPVDESFINKFFDLDRCFVVNRLNIEGTDKQLVLINLHMSAYDEGGVIRAQQLEMLFNLMSYEYNNGNYVIAGGDWNHDIADSLTAFDSQQQVPSWVQQITEDDLPDNFKFASSKDNPTCRAAEMPYTKGVNYTVVIDGFIVSSNVDVVSVDNIVTVGEEDVEFLYSDHNAVKLVFSLIDSTSDEPEENDIHSVEEVKNEISQIVESLYVEDKKNLI